MWVLGIQTGAHVVCCSFTDCVHSWPRSPALSEKMTVLAEFGLKGTPRQVSS